MPGVFSVSQCNKQLRVLQLLYDIEVMWRKTIKHAVSMFYTLIKHGFLTNQSARTGNFLPGGGGGAVNHVPKNSRKLPKFLRSSQKETGVI